MRAGRLEVVKPWPAPEACAEVGKVVRATSEQLNAGWRWSYPGEPMEDQEGEGCMLKRA